MKPTVLYPLFLLFNTLIAIPVSKGNVTTEQVNYLQGVVGARTQDNMGVPANATENGLLLEGCKPVTMIFAKGTGESGNVGDASSPGPALVAEIRKAMGNENVTVQGIDYGATVEGFFFGGDEEGSDRYFNLTNDAATRCPSTKFIIGGYSQGAQLTHNAAARFSPMLTSRIAAAIVFGDPNESKPVGNVSTTSILSICHDGDIICGKPGFSTSAHLTYATDTPQAASFIVSKLR